MSGVPSRRRLVAFAARSHRDRQGSKCGRLQQDLKPLLSSIAWQRRDRRDKRTITVN